MSAFPYLGRENSERLLLREGAITRIPSSLCGNAAGSKNVILVVGDGMGWEMTRAGVIAKKVVAELKSLGCDIVTGCPGNQAALNTFAGRTLSNYYTEGNDPIVPLLTSFCVVSNNEFFLFRQGIRIVFSKSSRTHACYNRCYRYWQPESGQSLLAFNLFVERYHL